MSDDTPPVLACKVRRTSAETIADIMELGWIRLDDNVLDPTYGKGGFWKIVQMPPMQFVKADRKFDSSYDFRKPPEEWKGQFDVITFDPPYVAVGGRKTSGIPEFNDSYGIGGDSPKTPREMQTLMHEGVTALKECLVSHGIMIVKHMNYISSGKYWNAEHHLDIHASNSRFDLVDRLIAEGDPGIQPKGRRQVHARNNYSTFSIYRSRD